MDFYQIAEVDNKKDTIDIFPKFIVRPSKDLMVRGGSFYAIWDQERQIWSTNEFDVPRLVDEELKSYKIKNKDPEKRIHYKTLTDYSSGMWTKFKSYLKDICDTAIQLDENLTFANTKTKKTDYVSKRLPYSLEKGSIDAYDELMSVLYEPEERRKLEWAIGAIVAGDAKHIQKFIVLYGDPGSGKSTFLNIVQDLFTGYYTIFEARALVGVNNSFSTETFRNDPLLAIQHDGDLSKIDDNTKLNSIISHEEMLLNEKYKPSYISRMNCFLFMGTNKPVRITDSNSGIIRRLIDVQPSGNRVPPKKYEALMNQISFEYGAIAWHCLQVYRSIGKNYYKTYRPLKMMFRTDVFFNFVEDNYHIFKEQDGVTLKQAYTMYKAYCDDSLVEFKLPLYKFREELKSYFSSFMDRVRIDGTQLRSYYSGFLIDKFQQTESGNIEKSYSLVMDDTISILDEFLEDCPAQYASETETPEKKWNDIKTTLGDLDTKQLHYVRPPKNHIVIDFDLKDEDGKKSLERNLEAASKWPPTYSEFSKSGLGVHLHYNYENDISKLSRIYDVGIEILVFAGKSALRRKLTKCNSSPIASINDGLPLKGEKKVINFEVSTNEQAIRTMIQKNLNKEYHAGTKPSCDFIFKILEDANNSGMKYDVTDLRPKILAFANNSSNQSEYCVKLVNKMKFASEEVSEDKEEYVSDEIVFFDVEVFPNLFVVVWKSEGKDPIKMINPTAEEIGKLLQFKLVGFNCRRYDNHILYARYIGYDNFQLYNLSQKLIGDSKNCMFGEAYNISYTDIYDFSSKKQSLKKFEIELGIHHQELGLKWDEEVPEDQWDRVADYCVNDVIATEATFNDRKQDFIARQILADLSGLSVNDTTQTHAARIIFGNDKRPQDKFVYTDLSEMFPGYIYDYGKSIYRDENPSEGGYVYAEPGMYTNVAVLDIASMHPTSIVELNMFGPYTQRFKELLDSRLEIKHKNYEKARTMLGGILSKYLNNEEDSPKLAYALKIVINIIYGLTSAKFDNKFRDPRNKDNIVAKRGALFMIDLKHAVQEKGYQVAHIKTDSIKIPNATKDIIDFVFEFGKKYGYTFEHEDTYEKFCLVNDAVYIAKIKGETKDRGWTATGAQFAHPYVFKTLFSHEPIIFEDMCETKSVTSYLYLDMNEEGDSDEYHNYYFVGKTGSFCPIKAGHGGGYLLREKDGKYHAATGSKGYRWLESETIKLLEKENDIDENYYIGLVDAAVKDISEFGDFEWFISDSDEEILINEPIGFNDYPPWEPTCDKEINCFDCPNSDECLPF